MTSEHAGLKVPDDYSLLYEDDFLFAIEKPAGIHSIGQQKSDSPSVAARLFAENSWLAAVGHDPLDGGLVHRLDFDTSGVLIGAKTQDIWNALHALLAGELGEKKYILVVEGNAPESIATNTLLGSRYRSSKKVRVYPIDANEPRAMEAHTKFKRLSYDSKNDTSIAEATISSGRRHQVRAHAAYMGHPLVGDALYGSTRPAYDSTRAFMLHATWVSFEHPVTRERVIIESRYDFEI